MICKSPLLYSLTPFPCNPAGQSCEWPGNDQQHQQVLHRKLKPEIYPPTEKKEGGGGRGERGGEGGEGWGGGGRETRRGGSQEEGEGTRYFSGWLSLRST